MVRDGYMQMRDKQIGNTAAAGSAEDIDIDELVAPDTAPPASGAAAQTASEPAELSASPTLCGRRYGRAVRTLV